MIHLDCNALSECCADITGISERIANYLVAISDTEYQRVKLDSRWTGDLNECIDKLREQLRNCSALSFSLDGIRQVYEQGEKRIIEFSEGATLLPPQPVVAQIDLKETVSFIREFIS